MVSFCLVLSVFDRRVLAINKGYTYYIFILLVLTNQNCVHEEIKSGLSTGNMSSLRYSSVYLPACCLKTWNLEHTGPECGALLYMIMECLPSH